MDDFKLFVYGLLGTIGIILTVTILIVLAPYLHILSWVVLAGVLACATGLAIRFILLPILNGSLDLFDKIADMFIKISDHRTQKAIAERTIPMDDNGNAVVYGVDPRLIIQLQGQYQQPVPSSIHWNYKGLEGKQGEQLALEAAKDIIPAIVRYADIADQVPSELSLLGIHPNTGHLEICSPERYKTAWFVGGSNTGKTNTVYGKVADAVRWGAKLIICDPHAHKPDSLTNKLKDFHHALLLPVAQSDHDILKALTTFLNEFKERRDNGKSCTEQWLIVTDEVNGLARHMARIDGKEVKMLSFLQELAETCGYEARGFGMFGFFISQKVAGLSWLRNAMMTVFVHGLLMESEAMLAANNDRNMAKQVMGFKTGRTLVYGYEFEPAILQQPKYDLPKDEHPNDYPNGKSVTSVAPVVSSHLSSNNQAVIIPEDGMEDSQEAVGRYQDGYRPDELRKMFLDIRKMREQGVSVDAILKHYNLNPGGRNNQNLQTVLEVISELDEEA